MQFYKRTNYLSSHLDELVKWAKLLKVGKNDIMFYKQTNGLASMFSFMMSIENISGVKWCEPLGIDESYDAFFKEQMNYEEYLQRNYECCEILKREMEE